MIEPLLPPWPERSPGPKPVPDRLGLQGILFVLHTGIPWQQLPLELGFVRADVLETSGAMAGSRGLRPAAPDTVGGTERGWRTGLESRMRGRLPRSREKGGAATGPSPVDRRKTGSKHHLITDGGGIPLKVITTAANVNDVTQTLALVDGIPPVAGRVGHPRRRPDALLGDNGYDSNPSRKEL